jgi:hypothetical protein
MTWPTNGPISAATAPKSLPDQLTKTFDFDGAGSVMAKIVAVGLWEATMMTLAHSSIDWGNVPAWVGALLTSGSLLQAFYIILRDRRSSEALRARQIITRVSGSSTSGVMSESEDVHVQFSYITFPMRYQRAGVAGHVSGHSDEES